MEWDIAGVVATVGANVTEFQVGDSVTNKITRDAIAQLATRLINSGLTC